MSVNSCQPTHVCLKPGKLNMYMEKQGTITFTPTSTWCAISTSCSLLSNFRSLLATSSVYFWASVVVRLGGCTSFRVVQQSRHAWTAKAAVPLVCINTNKIFSKTPPTTCAHQPQQKTMRNRAEFSLITGAFAVYLRFYPQLETKEIDLFWGQGSLTFVNCSEELKKTLKELSIYWVN